MLIIPFFILLTSALKHVIFTLRMALVASQKFWHVILSLSFYFTIVSMICSITYLCDWSNHLTSLVPNLLPAKLKGVIGGIFKIPSSQVVSQLAFIKCLLCARHFAKHQKYQERQKQKQTKKAPSLLSKTKLTVQLKI